MTHAEAYTIELAALYEGPHATKRLASALECSVATARAWLERRRALSLDAAIEAAARNPRAHEALMNRIAAVKELHESHGREAMARRRIVAARFVDGAGGSVGEAGSGRVVGRTKGAESAGAARSSCVLTGTVATGLLGAKP